MNALEILRAARAKIEDQSSWIKAAFAQSEDGRLVDAQGPEAKCFCAMGAVFAAIPPGDPVSGESRRAITALRSITRARSGHEYISVYNDHKSTTHGDVLSLFDEAINIVSAAE